MGLLYVFPVSREEEDFVTIQDGELVLKTYGLPYIFWLYALCAIGVVAFMFLAIKAPILKLIALGDSTDATLGYALLSFIGLIPVCILAFFFYEKRIFRRHKTIGMQHRVFGLPVFTETFEVEHLHIESYLSSPNVARLKNEPESLGFQNKGYFVLWMRTSTGKEIQLDRHSRKADLEKLKTLLSTDS